MSIAAKKEDSLIIDPSYIGRGQDEVTSVLRKKCKSCTRWLDDRDLMFGSCPYCLEARATSSSQFMRHYDSSKQEYPLCFNCNTSIYLVGLSTWDSVAQSHTLLCTECGEKQLEKDSQYRDSPWGYANKLK